jgi:hypothetical protein
MKTEVTRPTSTICLAGWGEHPISIGMCADVNSQVMKSTTLSHNKNSTGTQSSVGAASSIQPAIAASPTRVQVTRNAYDLYLTQGASFVSMKLITERASVTTSMFSEIRDEHYAAYPHGGLND